MNTVTDDALVTQKIAILFRAIEGRRKLIGEHYSSGIYSLLIAISHGYCCDNKFDVISLSAWAKLPRTTCQRDVGRLIKLGLVAREKDARRYLLIPTDRAIQRLENYIEEVFSHIDDVRSL